MVTIRIADIVDEAGFRAIPPCADPGFDHRTCDHWEDADRGSRAARLAWLEAPTAPSVAAPRVVPDNPFLADRPAPMANPFLAERPAPPPVNPFLLDDAGPIANPFAPAAGRSTAAPGSTAPRKLGLLTRGLGVVGSYAKVLYRDDVAAAYCQFGPLTAYPRAQRVRELYPSLPDAPLPAVITCISTTAAARREGLARRLVAVVCDDLAERGFTAVEAYPEAAKAIRPESTSAATPAFWETVGFTRVIDDDRFPVMRREFG